MGREVSRNEESQKGGGLVIHPMGTAQGVVVALVHQAHFHRWSGRASHRHAIPLFESQFPFRDCIYWFPEWDAHKGESYTTGYFWFQ